MVHLIVVGALCYLLGYVVGKHVRRLPRITVPHEIEAMPTYSISDSKSGASIIMPNPVKEAFDSGKVQDIGDITTHE